MSYKDTINKNIERVSALVDQKVQKTADGVPLFNWLELSPIDTCNRACTFCPKVDPSIAPNQNLTMPETCYRKMADELKDLSYQGTVMLAGYGEPLLSKNAVDMVRAFSPVANTEVTTNGDPLTPGLIGDLIEAGIGKIILSLYDGPHQIDEFTSLFNEAGAPEDVFILRDRWYSVDDEFGVKLTNRAGTVSVGHQPEVQTDKPCYYPHYMMMIDWNGDAFLCTQDWNRRVKSGNVFLTSLLDVWTSSNLRKYRKMLGNGKRGLWPCQGCNAVGTIHGEVHKDAWNEFYGK